MQCQFANLAELTKPVRMYFEKVMKYTVRVVDCSLASLLVRQGVVRGLRKR
jgi:hypothetical protein